MIKSTGIVRRMDDLGRFVVPVELRRTLDLEEGASLEIFTEGDTILLRRYQPYCTFCGRGGTMVCHHGKNICRRCLSTLPQAETQVH